MDATSAVNLNTVLLSVVGISLTVVGYFITRTLRSVDESMRGFHKRLSDVEEEMAETRGFNRGRLYERTAATAKSIAVFAVALMFGARLASAQTPTPATFYPLPQNNASFFTTLINYLYGEDAARDDTWAAPFKTTTAACLHPTAAGTTGTFSTTCTAFVAGNYTIEPAPSIDYTTFGATATDFCWVILTDTTTLAIGGWTRLPGTHYMGNCTASSASRPALGTPHAAYVMGTTLTAGAITAVLDAASRLPDVWRYTDASEITAVAGRIWLPDFGPFCISDAGGTCTPIPSGSVAGCALCGDSATSFFASGQIEAARGGTGDNTSATTGVPSIAAGNWTYASVLAAALGGTGLDNSAATGVQRFTAGTPSVQPFPDFRAISPAAEWGVDGTQCTLDATGQFANTNVPVSVATCADNTAGRIAGTFWLPAGYNPNTAMVFTLAAVNNSTAAGVLAFDLTCLCATNADAIDAANFPAAQNLDLTFDGTQSELVSTIAGAVTLTCGGTCAIGDLVLWRGVLDDTATTIAAPTNVKLLTMQIEADQTALSQ